MGRVRQKFETLSVEAAGKLTAFSWHLTRQSRQAKTLSLAPCRNRFGCES